MTIEQDIENISITKDEMKEIQNLVDSYPSSSMGHQMSANFVIIRLLLHIGNELTAIRQHLEKSKR